MLPSSRDPESSTIYTTTTYHYPSPRRSYPRRPRSVLLNTDTTQYDELKKILILSGIFFMGTIVMIMSKLQMQTEEVLRWSPIVWLLGVVIAGLTCNGIFYCRRLCLKRRTREGQLGEVYSSLPIPISYPCLAPPPHEGCCRDPSRGYPQPMYRRILALPPTYNESVQLDGNPMLPPKYEEAVSTPSPPPPSSTETTRIPSESLPSSRTLMEPTVITMI